MYKIAFKEIKGKEREKTKVIRIPLRRCECFQRHVGKILAIRGDYGGPGIFEALSSRKTL